MRQIAIPNHRGVGACAGLNSTYILFIAFRWKFEKKIRANSNMFFNPQIRISETPIMILKLSKSPKNIIVFTTIYKLMTLSQGDTDEINSESLAH